MSIQACDRRRPGSPGVAARQDDGYLCQPALAPPV